MLLRVRISVVAIALTFSSLCLFAQKLKKADKIIQDNLEAHNRYLSDEKLSDRRTGTPGEKTAADYISSGFSQAGLVPKGDHNGWLQAFTIDEGRQVGADAFLSINDHPLLLDKEYFPLPLSALGGLSGSPAVALQESGEPWFVDLKELVEGNAGDPHFDLVAAIRDRVAACAKKGATAIILYNSSKTTDRTKMVYNAQERPQPVSIPVFFITKEAKRKYLKDESASVDLKGRVAFTEKSRTGHNVIGFLDNGAASTIIIGTAYDKGMDPDGNSDPVSGVGASIELARMLKESRVKNRNYLFVAFSGDEQGMRGSAYFAEHPPVEWQKIKFMIGLQGLGRLEDSSHRLTIGGSGSSPAWADAFGRVTDKKSIALSFDSTTAASGDPLVISTKGIPAIFICTRRPASGSDPAGGSLRPLNVPGELQVVKFLFAMIQKLPAGL